MNNRIEALIPVAVEAFLASTGQAHTVTQLQRDLTTTCMRSALEAALAALPGGGVDDAMVERAARALHPGAWRVHDGKSEQFRQGTSETDVQRSLTTARIALTAALSPTPNPHEADQ